MHRHHTAPTAGAGLLLSLSSELPPSNRLARKARALADRLGRTPSPRLEDRAAALLSSLLTATDPGLTFGQDGLIDDRFDDGKTVAETACRRGLKPASDGTA